MWPGLVSNLQSSCLGPATAGQQTKQHAQPASLLSHKRSVCALLVFTTGRCSPGRDKGLC